MGTGCSGPRLTTLRNWENVAGEIELMLLSRLRTCKLNGGVFALRAIVLQVKDCEQWNDGWLLGKLERLFGANYLGINVKIVSFSEPLITTYNGRTDVILT